MTIDVNSRPFQIPHQLHQLCSNSTATSSKQQNPSAMLRWRFVDQVMIDTQSLGHRPTSNMKTLWSLMAFNSQRWKKLKFRFIWTYLPKPTRPFPLLTKTPPPMCWPNPHLPFQTPSNTQGTVCSNGRKSFQVVAWNVGGKAGPSG